MNRRARQTLIGVALAAVVAAPAGVAEQVTGVKAFHRAGH